jgi:glycerophosphoryl diester phosphodiesterase
MDAINARVIAEFKEKKLQVYVYTVDQAEDILWLAENKVDGIFANHPEQAYKIVNSLM